MQLDGSRVLVFGTTGAQGSGLLEAVLARGAVPVRASSRPATVDAWRGQGQQAVHADLTDAASIDLSLADADAHAAALHVPLSSGSPEGVAAVVGSVERMRQAGLPVTVNLGTPVPAEDAPDPFGARRSAEAFLATGATVLTPTAYLENHAAPWALGPLSDGVLVYPRPARYPLAWVTARDVTAAAVAALAADVGADLLRLAGPQVLTFDELAAELGAGLGRDVAFRRVGAEAFADLLRPVVGEQAAAGVAAAYDAMPEEPDPAMAVDASATWARLGLDPTPARRWAREVLAPLLAGEVARSA